MRVLIDCDGKSVTKYIKRGLKFSFHLTLASSKAFEKVVFPNEETTTKNTKVVLPKWIIIKTTARSVIRAMVYQVLEGVFLKEFKIKEERVKNNILLFYVLQELVQKSLIDWNFKFLAIILVMF